MLDWTGLVLNAHYTQLVLMPEAHELLVSCHKLVAQQVQDIVSHFNVLIFWRQI